MGFWTNAKGHGHFHFSRPYDEYKEILDIEDDEEEDDEDYYDDDEWDEDEDEY